MQHKGIEITVKRCGHCFGSGARPSDELVEAVQQGLETGKLDSDDLIAIAKMIEAWPHSMKGQTDAQP